jgi:hypothetical protein
MTINAPIIEPLATPNASPAWLAGGAGPALGLADCAPRDALPVGVLEKDADGPIALLLTVLTAPLIVARLLCTLATGPLSLADIDMEADADFTLALELIATLADELAV